MFENISEDVFKYLLLFEVYVNSLVVIFGQEYVFFFFVYLVELFVYEIILLNIFVNFKVEFD